MWLILDAPDLTQPRRGQPPCIMGKGANRVGTIDGSPRGRGGQRTSSPTPLRGGEGRERRCVVTMWQVGGDGRFSLWKGMGV